MKDCVLRNPLLPDPQVPSFPCQHEISDPEVQLLLRTHIQIWNDGELQVSIVQFPDAFGVHL